MSTNAAIIIKGEDRELTLLITDEKQDKVDLTGLTAASALLKNQDGTTLTKSLGAGSIEIVSATNGKLKLILSDTETGLLKKGELQTFSLRLDWGTVRRICKFRKSLTVEEEA